MKGSGSDSISFLITIDTEGDNLWATPESVTTNNASLLPRFQTLCEKYRLKPTYLTNYEMARSPEFQELGRDVIKGNTGEIGMHLHPWDMPPRFELTENDSRYQPYLVDYPESVLREKVKLMTRLLEDTFETRMLSHRAGRWAFNDLYAQVLVEHGYRVDCSVTPHVSWAHVLGDPDGNGGTDYSQFPAEAYFVDPEDIATPGQSSLLEVPVSIIRNRAISVVEKAQTVRGLGRLLGRALRHLPASLIWLRPDGGNRELMKKLLRKAVADGADYVEFMLHSSELMPGGSPTFPSEASIEELYDDLEALFADTRESFTGQTLSEYHQKFVSRGSAGAERTSE
jgi:hypothetical protein